jgi:hypothetical protein
MKKIVRITESQLDRIIKERVEVNELEREEFRHGENFQALRDALKKNIIIGVAFVKKDGTVSHKSIKRTLGSYIPSTAEKTDRQQNVNENNNTKRVIDVNAYIKALRANGGNKEQAASAAWRTFYFQNVLGFIAGSNFIDLREENEIMARFGEQVYNSLTRSMVAAMAQQHNQDNAELEHINQENPEEPIDENMLPQSNDLVKYPLFIKHWENKFERSVEILLKVGQGTDELINKINVIKEKI